MGGAIVRSSTLGAVLVCVVVACGSRLNVPDPSVTLVASPTAAVGNCGAAPQTVTASLLFASDLSARCPTFLTISDPFATVRAGHEAAGYRATLFGSQSFAGVLKRPQYFATPTADQRIAVDVQWISGSGKDYLGVVCRSVGTPRAPGRWYDLVVGADGSYLIEFWKGNPPVLRLLASGVGPAPVSGWNRVHADCVGSTLSLYLNGQFVASADDSEAPDGDSGVYMRALANNGGEYLFKDFLVTSR